jgi:hypothetical protein
MNLEAILQEHAEKTAQIEAQNVKALEAKQQQEAKAAAVRQCQNEAIQAFLNSKVKTVFEENGHAMAAKGLHYQIESRDLADHIRGVHNVEVSITFHLQGEKARTYSFFCLGDLNIHAITFSQGVDGTGGGVIIQDYLHRSPDSVSKEEVESLFGAFVTKSLENERRVKALL